MTFRFPPALTPSSFGVVVRQSANKLKKKSDAEVLDTNVFIADVTTPGSLAAAMEGMDEVVLCTSAVPKVREAKRRHHTTIQHCSLL